MSSGSGLQEISEKSENTGWIELERSFSSPGLGISGRCQSERRHGLAFGRRVLTLGGRGRRLRLLADTCSNRLSHEAGETREVEGQPTRWRPGRTGKKHLD